MQHQVIVEVSTDIRPGCRDQMAHIWKRRDLGLTSETPGQRRVGLRQGDGGGADTGERMGGMQELGGGCQWGKKGSHL